MSQAVDSSGCILETQDEIVAEVAEILEGRSQQEALTSAEIKNRLHMADETARPKTRAIIRRVIQEQDLPVGSSPTHGYWEIQDVDELENTLTGLRSRRESIDERMQEITGAFNRVSSMSLDVTHQQPGPSLQTRVPVAGGVLVYGPAKLGKELVGFEAVEDWDDLEEALTARGHDRGAIYLLPETFARDLHLYRMKSKHDISGI